MVMMTMQVNYLPSGAFELTCSPVRTLCAHFSVRTRDKTQRILLKKTAHCEPKCEPIKKALNALLLLA